METLVIASAAFVISGLTLFSGFGLGTLLLPMFALFYPVDLSVALTAIVHLLNNLLKLSLLGRQASLPVVLRFGLPSLLGSFAGAASLVRLSQSGPALAYELAGRTFETTPLRLVLAVLMIAFAVLEIHPRLSSLSVDRRYLSLGGILSGFFGGLSGHQGALRSAFLLRAGLTKEGFIASGVVVACMVDAARLPVYIAHFSAEGIRESGTLLAISVLSAFSGVYAGNRLMKKVTYRNVQLLVSFLLCGIAAALGAGWI